MEVKSDQEIFSCFTEPNESSTSKRRSDDDLKEQAFAPATKCGGQIGDDFISFDFSEDEQDNEVRDMEDVDTAKNVDKDNDNNNNGSHKRTASKSVDQNNNSKRVDLSSETKKRLGKLFHNKAPWIPVHLKGREIGEHYGYLTASKPRHFSERLHQELLDLAAYLSPTAAESAGRSLVVRKCDAVVRKLFPGRRVESFGSFETGLYLPTSDIDLVVTCINASNDDEEDEYSRPPLKKLARALIKAGIADPRSVQVIGHARVPIIKFIDRLTGHSVDISFNVVSGLDGARFLKEQLQLYPALRPLILFLKLFLDLRGLNEVFRGGLGSFSAACLLISFFQLHPLIQLGYLRAEDNLGVLLLEFLELYGRLLHYERVGISVGIDSKSAEVLEEEEEESVSLIDVPFGYYDKMDRGFFNESRPGLLSIQDPQSPTNDLARPSFSISSVRQAFEHAYNLLTAAAHEIDSEAANQRHSNHGYSRTDGSLLAALIELPEKFLKHREYIKRTISVR